MREVFGARLIEKIQPHQVRTCMDLRGQTAKARANREKALLSHVFNKSRRAAGVSFQFRDIRAKTAGDTRDLAHSQRLLGHKNREMTEHYVRERIGQLVRPLR